MSEEIRFPTQPTSLRPPDLVEVITLDPTLRLDIHYARSDNFIGRPVYEEARAFLQRPAAEALVRVHQSLQSEGLGLLIFDGYRPWRVTRIFWEETPPERRGFVADPRRGSRHNRGCAVDLTLFDLTTGDPLPMPSGFDEMTQRSHIQYDGGTESERAHRRRLQAAMTGAGFTPFEPEWWHFDYFEWDLYPVLDLNFAELGS
ncbi:MAG: M15 family metallopeptidase [Synechococcaceae cyanobacterium SM2_3_2]|nr:M15 family metallopeptidase [Synechococcaceae cyanobacterium SM2_3_2]